ncbi:hypothetical protein [Phocaeicola vulgatus]|jgi:hypothetical protein|nr:hypothetical protein [Phocaeicola vulgatus]MCG0164267.1 hypothetical protein [Phocaeicola vulgatus]
MDLNNIVGFKAVDKNGNERQVTVDEMTELVSARIVSAASEISTFAAAAAAGTDEFEDQLPQSDTFSWLRTLDGSKNPTLTSSTAAAKVLGELLPTASNEKKGLMPIGQALTNEFVLKSGEVLLLSTSENSVVYNVVIWHPWRGMASYQILICRDDKRKIYKVIALSNLLSQKFYVKIDGYNVISMYLKNNDSGSMNIRIQPVTSFKTTPVIATLPEDAIEVAAE